MPLGPTHRRATIALLPPAAVTTFYVTGFTEQSRLLAIMACTIGIIVSLVMNPDLDLLENSIRSKLLRLSPPHVLERQLLTRLTWYIVINPVRWIWWISWYPYSKMIPHRSWVSHTPLVGTGIRIAYWFGALAAAGLVAMWLLGWPLQLASPLAGYGWLAVPAAAGLAASDALHWLMDKVL